MKKLLTLIITLTYSLLTSAQNTFPNNGNVGIGTLDPDPSSMLEVASSSRGVLVPRMTMNERDAIASPATSLLIYQTDNFPGFYYYNGASWIGLVQIGANKDLSNLSATGINTDLVPDGNQTHDLGSSTNNWKDVYAERVQIDDVVYLSNSGNNNYKTTLVGETDNITNTANDNTFVGWHSGMDNTIGVSNTFVGSDCGTNNTDGGRNCFFGVNSGNANISGRKNCFFGFSAGNFNTTGYTNAFFGYKCGMYNSSGNVNTFVGNETGHLNTTGSMNSFFGSGAGHDNTVGQMNTFLGFGSGQGNTSGNLNIFIGFSSGFKSTTADHNVFIGSNSGRNNLTGSNNVLIGDSTGYKNTTGFQNTFIGDDAGFNHLSGNNNTFLGRSAGSDVTTGSANALIGAKVSTTTGNISNSIGIGYNFNINQSNIIQLGNSLITKIGIGKNPEADDILDFAVTTAKLTTGGVWTNASDKKLKNNFQDLSADDILNKVNQLRIQRWHYIADREPSTHIGPVAQDFHQLFGVGDDTTISTIDPSGVALLAIQALSTKVEEKDEMMAKQQATIEQQQAQIDQLKNDIAQMQQSLSQCCMNYQNANQQQRTSTDDEGRLEQNAPNPFSENTIIKYYLPAASKSAQVIISSIEGVELKSYPLQGMGLNEITINARTLTDGEYIYSLVIDGKKIDSKRMVLTR